MDAPGNVTAESGPARVILSWDAVDADSYDVFLDGVMVASTGSSSTQVLGPVSYTHLTLPTKA